MYTVNAFAKLLFAMPLLTHSVTGANEDKGKYTLNTFTEEKFYSITKIKAYTILGRKDIYNSRD